LPAGKGKVTVNTGKLSGTELKSWWYDPRTGKAEAGVTFAKGETKEFSAPAGEGMDWVLVLDDAGKNYSAPGKGNWIENRAFDFGTNPDIPLFASEPAKW
jgi:hypothetical protein